ncbi:MAG: SLC45 family MFS transporter [Leptolyngbya sp. SIO4C1]|nr:SLC45 family MFS transporter [Leptolyngbya sp. SIO4C1]
MNFGFLGIQFGWGLQMANASAIFESLGAEVHQLPLLWLAAPLTGLIVQPVIGFMSDRTWTPLGRRRPYFLGGAILSSIALVFMPNSPNLWVAAGLLWLLDASVNVSMTPFRSFVSDLVPDHQQTAGFSMQSLLLGLGAVIASALPWLIAHGLHTQPVGHGVPPSVKLSFYVGAAVFLGAVLWTVVTTSETKPEPSEQAASPTDFRRAFSTIGQAFTTMPPTMRQLAWVQCFSWLGLFCMFLYLPPAIARNIFGATELGSELYAAGIEWAGLCMATYNLVCCLFSLSLPRLSRLLGQRLTHTLCLLAGAAGLVSLGVIHSPYWVLLSMVGVGLAWASMLSLPYAMLVESLPAEQNCLYMGIFNCFIVIPEIIASLGLGWVMRYWLGSDRMLAVVLGGALMFVGAILAQRIRLPKSEETYQSGSSLP